MKKDEIAAIIQESVDSGDLKEALFATDDAALLIMSPATFRVVISMLLSRNKKLRPAMLAAMMDNLQF